MKTGMPEWIAKLIEKNSIEIGSHVEWKQGKPKCGVVLDFSPPMRHLSLVENSLREGGLEFKSVYVGSGYRYESTYAVLVKNGDKVPRLYWKNFRSLRKIKLIEEQA